MTCKLCDSEKLVAKGLCSKHYYQQRYQKIREEVCLIEGCKTRRNSSTGYCGFHYTSLRLLEDPLARGMVGEFCRRGHQDAWIITPKGQRRCRECDREHDRRRNQDPDRKRYNQNKRLIDSYGITVEDFELMWIEQDGKCAICEFDLSKGKGGHAIDHNHDTNRVRGLLCRQCNNGLGHFRDSIVILEKASGYLKAYEEPN